LAACDQQSLAVPPLSSDNSHFHFANWESFRSPPPESGIFSAALP